MLKSELYVKTVLTVIAFALLWVGFTLNTKPVQAQSITRVIITGIEFPNGRYTLPVGIKATTWEPDPDGSGGVWSTGPLPVAIMNRSLTVTLGKDRTSEKPK